ncbi:hypothetical protein Tco_1326940 [Tanacetum coccineum]
MAMVRACFGFFLELRRPSSPGLRTVRQENWEEYDNHENLPFRRRVFPSHLDGQPITGIDIENAISGPTFAELYDDDAVGLCCLGILQLVLLGAENRRYPRVATWRKKKGRFLAEMVIPFFEGNIHAARLTPDDNEARSDWWISSKAYFDGFIDSQFELNSKHARMVRLIQWNENMGDPPNFQTPMLSQLSSLCIGKRKMQSRRVQSLLCGPSSHPGSLLFVWSSPSSHMVRPNLTNTIEST